LVEYRRHIVHVIHGVDPFVDGTPFGQSWDGYYDHARHSRVTTVTNSAFGIVLQADGTRTQGPA
jgi:hypothetical protein